MKIKFLLMICFFCFSSFADEAKNEAKVIEKKLINALEDDRRDTMRMRKNVGIKISNENLSANKKTNSK